MIHFTVAFTDKQFANICAATVANAAKYTAYLNAAMNYYDINTAARVAMFLAQISWESSRLTRTEENLSYTAKRLTQVWPSRFPTLAAAEPYAMNPKALANKVYGGRLGNTLPNSGWLYRGRGLKMLTGYANYRAAELGLGMKFTGSENFAGRVAQPEGAVWTAAWFWCMNKLNDVADRGDFRRSTIIINGGLTGYEDGNRFGLDDRVELWEYAQARLVEMDYA